MRKTFFLALIVLLTLVAIPTVVLADDGTTVPPIVDLYSFIDLAKFILAGGVGVAVALVVEWWPKFSALTPTAKFWWVCGMFVVFPIVAQLLIHLVSGFPVDVVSALNAYMAAIIYGVTAWIASQWSHKLDRKLVS